jgi:hypothetical protein
MIVPLRYESQRAMIREAMPVDVVVKATRGPRGLDRRRSRKQRRRARAANGRDERGLVLFPILGRAATKRTLSGHRHTNETLPDHQEAITKNGPPATGCPKGRSARSSRQMGVPLPEAARPTLSFAELELRQPVGQEALRRRCAEMIVAKGYSAISSSMFKKALLCSVT